MSQQKRRHRRADMAILIACVIAIIVTTVNAVQVQKVQSQQNQQQAHLGRQFQQLVQACVRLNILRAEDNLSHYADYQVFKAVYIESKLSQKLIATTIVRIEGKRLATRSQKLNGKILAPFNVALREKAWSPLTDCAKAVSEHGPYYRPARPVLFTKRLPPRVDLYPPDKSPYLGGE